MWASVRSDVGVLFPCSAIRTIVPGQDKYAGLVVLFGRGFVVLVGLPLARLFPALTFCDCVVVGAAVRVALGALVGAAVGAATEVFGDGPFLPLCLASKWFCRAE